MLITNGTLVKPGLRRRTIQRQISLGPVSLRLVTILIVAAAAVIALAQSTQSATKNYEVEKLKSEVSSKEKEMKELQTESIRLRAYRTLLETQVTPSPMP